MTWLRGLAKCRLLALAVVAFVIGLLEFLPAHLFEDRINRALPPPWHLTVSGTIWDGLGVLRAGQAFDALIVPLTWKFNPRALARLRLGWKIVPASPALSGSVNIGAGWQSLEFRDAALIMDAATLQQAVPVIAIFAPSGNIFVSTPQDAGLTMDYGNDLRLNGDAHIKADNFGLRPFSPQPLGNYQLTFTARDTTIAYVITQSSGALKLDGGGSIQTASPRQIAYSGTLTPSPALPDNILSQLKAMGHPAGDGRLRVDWQGRW